MRALPARLRSSSRSGPQTIGPAGVGLSTWQQDHAAWSRSPAHGRRGQEGEDETGDSARPMIVGRVGAAAESLAGVNIETRKSHAERLRRQSSESR